MDQIIIENLEIFAYHGVLQEENENGQLFYINAVLSTDTRKAGQTDDLTNSVDYGEVCILIQKLVQEKTYQLIETVAEEVAKGILCTYDKIERVIIEIRKPSAPIIIPFQSVSVKIERGWHTAYIALGSNMGDRESHLKNGLAAIDDNPYCKVIKSSDFIKTDPYGNLNQNQFVNAVTEIKTLLIPEELLVLLNEIEKREGRERKEHWGPRTLDLDIVFYEDKIIATEKLTIPHIDMENREFVLKPMTQIARYWKHPVNGLTMKELLDKLEQTSDII